MHDRVCLDAAAKVCDNTYRVLGVYKADALSNLKASGIVGLAPVNSKGSSYPLFMEEMYNAGAITSKVFSLYITNYFDGYQSQGSKLLIGGFNLEKFAKADSKITWNYLVNTNYWAVELVKVNVKGFDLKTRSTVAIVDSGTSYVMLPKEDHRKLVAYFKSEF